MRNVLLATIALTLLLSPASANGPGQGTEVRSCGSGLVFMAMWINTDHIHRVICLALLPVTQLW